MNIEGSENESKFECLIEIRIFELRLTSLYTTVVFCPNNFTFHVRKSSWPILANYQTDWLKSQIIRITGSNKLCTVR